MNLKGPPQGPPDELAQSPSPGSRPLGSLRLIGSLSANAYGLVELAVRGMMSGSRLKKRPMIGS